MNKHLTSAELPTRQYRFILAILLFEICTYFLCNIHIASFQKNTFIAFEQDPLLWLIYFTDFPQFILTNSFLCYAIDCFILILLVTLIFKPSKNGSQYFYCFYCLFSIAYLQRIQVIEIISQVICLFYFHFFLQKQKINKLLLS